MVLEKDVQEAPIDVMVMCPQILTTYYIPLYFINQIKRVYSTWVTG